MNFGKHKNWTIKGMKERKKRKRREKQREKERNREKKRGHN